MLQKYKRPGWKNFTAISVGNGIAASILFVLFRPSYNAGVWADLALTVTASIFVLGVSVATLARSMSESGRFAVEYLDKSCRMEWFCCLTLMGVLAAVVCRFLSTLVTCPQIIYQL